MAAPTIHRTKTQSNTPASSPYVGATVHANLPPARLVEAAIARQEGILARGGGLVVRTGKHTGRSPKDKFIVDEPGTHDRVWWGGFNQAIEPERYEAIRARIIDHLAARETFVQDAFVGADPAHRRSVRVTTETAWANLFADNMFLRPTAEQLADYRPDFLIFDAPTFKADPARDGTREETIILVHLSRREILIGGTAYAGEIKKGAFGVMNFQLPLEGVLPMHASANMGPAGDVAVFFGLSGTGKTTLSADPSRTLIGDDEHGWSDQGVFNFEGGCYAKTIRLSPRYEPDIYATTRRFGTILENVVVDPETRELDLDSDAYTENTRVAYPIDFMGNTEPTGMGGQPTNIVLLTADAFGVMPPVARLSIDQARYHFISGYTSKLAGTEVGVTEPQATFSLCFGAPFMPLHPATYSKMLGERLARHEVRAWLINTGWTGGPYGTGERMNIAWTRAMVEAALTGKLEGVETVADPRFGFQVPTACPGVPADVLQPRSTWADKEAYDLQARKLAAMFVENFKRFEDAADAEVKAAGPRAE
ncbi:MAG TPA: phosphoenolpyruvate carboxykinase (ATP) [Candidatus Limnocylindrales bacterium]|nr:phosphoenolpyruvate carboxykinase (ATP) [Candidatus Limnocylindrales bacterium]